MTTTDKNAKSGTQNAENQEIGTQRTVRRVSARTGKATSTRKLSPKPSKPQETDEPVRSKAAAKRGRAAPPTTVPSAVAPTDVARTTKKQVCLALLSRADGASIEELQLATGWQAHSVRGFLSGEVRKRLGHQLESVPTKSGERRYRIPGAGTAS